MKVVLPILGAASLAKALSLRSPRLSTERSNTLDGSWKRQQFSAPAPLDPSLPPADGLSYIVPSPKPNGGSSWGAAYEDAKALVAQMNLTEKVGLVVGQNGPCVGNTGAVERLGLPSLCLWDGPGGPRPPGTSQFPAGVNAMATWNRDLIYQRSLAMGQEFFDTGIQIALTPVTGGTLGRSPRGGRNFEAWAPDPYSTGEASYLSTKGINDAGVTSTAKHLIGYEQETSRNTYNRAGIGNRFGVNQQLPIDAIIDSKTTHELYLWGFAESVRAGVGYVMTSYNMVNGTWGSANSETINGMLKGELNFQGATMTDWGGLWEYLPTFLAGNEMSMPGDAFGGLYGTFGRELPELVQNGTISQELLDDSVIRVLTPYFAAGLDKNPVPPVLASLRNLGANDLVSLKLVQQQSTVDLIKKIGEDSATLLKNTNGALPLTKPRSIGVIGEDAGPNLLGYAACGQVSYDCPIWNNNGTRSAGAGSGYSDPLNLIDPLAAIRFRALKDRIRVQAILNNTAIEDAVGIARSSDVALVFVGSQGSESTDRKPLDVFDSNGKELIEAVAAVNNNTMVIMHIPGPVVVEEWYDNPNITAIVAAYYPGEQSGLSLTSVLWGDVSPSGKLPFTIGKAESDYPPNTISEDFDSRTPTAVFSEGLEIDYRWFDSQGIEPRYEFGYGLSYSSFEYSNIALEPAFKADHTSIQKTAEQWVGQSEGESLYDELLKVTVDVTNKGKVMACEVAQLYIEFPTSENEPPRQMRGFDKIKQLEAGATRQATFPLRRKDVMVWDTVLQKWRLPTDGFVTFHVGASSRKLPLSVRHTF